MRARFLYVNAADSYGILIGRDRDIDWQPPR